MTRFRTFILTATLTISALVLPSSSALAGGCGPTECTPLNISAPAGFSRAYATQFELVASNCWAEMGNTHRYQRAVAEFNRNEQRLDRRLARRGLPASPTWFDFANEPFQGQSSECPLG